jgi:hypothetical protein
MTDTRAAFEAWAATYGYETISDAEGLYWDDGAQMVWLCWQAAIKHEREECAKVCEDVRDVGDGAVIAAFEDFHDDGHIDGCNNCAAAIRARS